VELNVLVCHWQLEHGSVTESSLRPFALPWKANEKELPALPDSLPSYFSTNLHVHASPFDKEHRKKLSSWVLKRIYGLLPQWRYNLVNSMGEDVPLHSEDPFFEVGGHYDFLIAPRLPLPLVNALPTHEASRSAACAEGWIIRGPRPKKVHSKFN